VQRLLITASNNKSSWRWAKWSRGILGKCFKKSFYLIV